MRPFFASPRRSAIGLGLVALLATSVAPPGDSCPMILPDGSADLTVELAPGVEATITANYFESRNDEGEVVDRWCNASAAVPLSAFPSLATRLDTADLAEEIRAQATEWEVSACTISVFYVNDTAAELADHELCVSADYQYADGRHWSTRSQGNCWEPIDVSAEDWDLVIEPADDDVELEFFDDQGEEFFDDDTPLDEMELA